LSEFKRNQRIKRVKVIGSQMKHEISSSKSHFWQYKFNWKHRKRGKKMAKTQKSNHEVDYSRLPNFMRESLSRSSRNDSPWKEPNRAPNFFYRRVGTCKSRREPYFPDWTRIYYIGRGDTDFLHSIPRSAIDLEPPEAYRFKDRLIASFLLLCA